MSKCISHHGEYSDCAPDQSFVCKRCSVLDEDALFAKVEQLSATIELVKALAQGWTDDFMTRVHTYDDRDDRADARDDCAMDIRAALDATP